MENNDGKVYYNDGITRKGVVYVRSARAISLETKEKLTYTSPQSKLLARQGSMERTQAMKESGLRPVTVNGRTYAKGSQIRRYLALRLIEADKNGDNFNR